MKKILLLLVLAMLFPTIMACANPGTTVGSDTADTTDTSKEPTEEDTHPSNATKPEDFDDQGNITLDGWTDYVIVRGKNCSKSEKTAALQLSVYIKKISGAMLKVVNDSTEPVEKEIVVGKTNRENEGEFDREELGDEGFIIKTLDKKLFIVGGEKRGTLYGVYTYLEEYLGCRFYTASFEKVPELNAVPFIEIEEDKQIPVFDTRNPGWADYFGHEISVKRKINGSHCRGDFDESFGGNLTWAGNPWHSLYTLAEMNGNSFNHEPCLSDENVYQTVLKNVRALLAAKPNARYISVSQNDSDLSDHACKCEKCNAVYESTGSRSGMYIKFVNRIAEAIKEEYPNVMIHTFAYKFTREAPRNIEVADNVMVQFCTIEACFRHPFTECQSSLYDRSHDIERLLGDWAEVCKYLSVWDYTTNFWRYNLTFPNFDAIYDNIQLFANNNVKYVFAQGDCNATNGEFSELRAYLLSRLLWDPYMSREQYYAYMDEFLTDYYGEGGVKIREYIDLTLSETEDKCIFCYDTENIFPNSAVTVRNPNEIPTTISETDLSLFEKVDWTPYYDWFIEYTPSPVLSQGKILFEEAYALAKTDEEKLHIEKSATQIALLELCFTRQRIEIVEKNIYDVTYAAAREILTSGNEETWQLVANAIKSHVSKNLLDDFTQLNKKYFDRLVKFNIVENELQQTLDPSKYYNFSKMPWEW